MKPQNTQWEKEPWLTTAKELRKDPESPVNAWKRHAEDWCDFLMDYGIGIDNLYHQSDDSPYPYLDLHRRLRAQGRTGWFNLGYWDYPRTLDDAAKAARRGSGSSPATARRRRTTGADPMRVRSPRRCRPS